MSAASAVAILKRTNTVTRLIYFLYQLLQIALTPAVALYLLYRGLRDRRYFAHIGERLGLLPHSLQTTGSGAIWFHAVSVGEVLSLVELLRRLARRAPFGAIIRLDDHAGRARHRRRKACGPGRRRVLRAA